MDPTNTLVIFTVENNIPIYKKEVVFNKYIEWNSFDDLKNCFSKDLLKIKYFDEEAELISLLNEEDFIVFKELLLEKQFPNDEVVVIGYEGCLDMRKFGRLEKVLKLTIESAEITSSFVHLKSTSNNTSMNQNADYDTSSSTSSSSLVVRKRKPEKNRKFKHIVRYAAKFKKEINYLSGSEVSDGQTILKKWRIKNIGSKKWKENSVKSVLLPSDYSNWITCSSIKVPTCFADQKVDIEMEISINGQWSTTESSVGECSRDILLTWLLFKDSLLTKSSDNFKDYILTQLELSITVRKRSNGTDIRSSLTNNALKKHLSESSIERIDQDFSIVNMSDEDQISNKTDIDSNESVSGTDEKVKENVTNDIALELPDCPHGDDFQISDFQIMDQSKSMDNSHFVESILDQSANKESIGNDSDEKENAQIDLIPVESNPRCEEISVRHEEEILILNNDESSSAEIIAISRVDDHPYNSTNTQEVPISIDDIDKETLLNVKEIPLETNFTEISYSMIDDGQRSLEQDKCIVTESGEETEIRMCRNEDEIVANESLKEQELAENNAHENEQDLTVNKETDNVEVNVNGSEDIVVELTNNLCEPLSDNISGVHRQIPVDSIRNKFPRATEGPVMTTSQYLPAYDYPIFVAHNTNYVAGVGCTTMVNNQPTSNYVPGCPNYYQPHQPYQCPTGTIYPVVNMSPPVNMQTTNGDQIIENLRRDGNLPVNINDSAPLIRAENGQHYVTTANMKALRTMGFTDEDRNMRLLMKFNNNINDVITDLID